MVRTLLSIAVVLLVLWVAVKLVLGVVGAAFHLLLVGGVLVGLYALVRAGAERRTLAPARGAWGRSLGACFDRAPEVTETVGVATWPDPRRRTPEVCRRGRGSGARRKDSSLTRIDHPVRDARGHRDASAKSPRASKNVVTALTAPLLVKYGYLGGKETSKC